MAVAFSIRKLKIRHFHSSNPNVVKKSSENYSFGQLFLNLNKLYLLTSLCDLIIYINPIKPINMKAKLVFALLFILSFASAQNTLVFQPGGGANDGKDEGTLTGGKDTWVNRDAPTGNNGSLEYSLCSPRSNCNESDYKSYFKFDVSTLPDSVSSVFFGVAHFEHTNVCYSNCSADFYFYRCTSAWDEMTLVQSILPSEETEPFYGPIPITFPNNFGGQEYDITSAYRYWKKNPNTNFGFTVYSPVLDCNNACVYFGVKTSDDTVKANRPYLKIESPVTTGISQKTLNPVFSPNPFNDYIKFYLPNMQSYYFTNIKGQKMKVEYDSFSNQFNTASLPRGLYFLHVFTDERETVVKLMK